MRSIIIVSLLASPLALGKNVDIRCNVIAHCQSEWESQLEHFPPQLRLVCQGQSVPVKVTTTREPQWQKISFEF